MNAPDSICVITGKKWPRRRVGRPCALLHDSATPSTQRSFVAHQFIAGDKTGHALRYVYHRSAKCGRVETVLAMPCAT